MTATPPPVAQGTRLRMDRSSRRRRRVVIGGSPLLFLRLSERGAQLVARWANGEPVGADPAARALATRLVDSGIAHPFPHCCGPPPGDVDVVIPVRDRPRGLAATVASLGSVGGLVVVDDGSADPDAAVVAAGDRARIVRHPDARGPAAARNDGWRAATRPLVAFIDADCIATPGWLEGLLTYFADARVAAVAPRITAGSPAGAPRAIAVYDRSHSPLDMGSRPGPIRPRSWVPYVPTACLVVRRSCLEAVGGFDESLRSGEDVDLIWRLGQTGWALRYAPSVTVEHPVRPTWHQWLAQRYSYGRSAAQLAARHRDATAPLDISRWVGAAWAAGACIHPAVGVAIAAADTVALTRRAPNVPARELVRAVVLGYGRSAVSISRVIGREWWPFAMATALVSKRARRAVLVATLAPPLAGWVRRRPPIDPPTWCALRLADGMAYGVGVWAGCVTARSAAALRPRLRTARPDRPHIPEGIGSSAI